MNEKCDLRVFRFSQVVQKHKLLDVAPVKSLLIAYFIGSISAKKCQNPFTIVKVMASQTWDYFETRCIISFVTSQFI